MRDVRRRRTGVRSSGPPQDQRGQLEKLFGLSGSLPLSQQASWSFSVTDPDLAPYEILLLDNRTRRGYDDANAPPANLSIEAISTQIPANGPAGSAVSVVIAPLPVVGYPPTEEAPAAAAEPVAGPSARAGARARSITGTRPFRMSSVTTSSAG